MSTVEHYGTLFPAAVVGSLPRPDFVRAVVTGEREVSAERASQVMDAAVAYAVVLQEEAIGFFEGALQCRDLFHDLRAVAFVLDHADDATEVTSHRLESIEQRLLMLGFHGRSLACPTPPGVG